MRLVTFHHDRGERIGVQLESNILDLSRIGMPMDMKTFLSLGETALAQTHEDEQRRLGEPAELPELGLHRTQSRWPT
jgi:hypothetical protein